MLHVGIRLIYEFDIKFYEYITDLDGAWELYWWMQSGLNKRLFGSCEKIEMIVMDGNGIKYDMSKGKFYTILTDNNGRMIIECQPPPKMLPVTLVTIGDDGVQRIIKE